MEKDRMKKQWEFALEIDKEKYIGRQTWLSDGKRKENDAEHAWHAALMAVVFSEYANENIDVLKTVLMILIHDLVEIDSGDTYAYDEEGKKTQRQREERGADRIFGMLPEDQGKQFRALWEEFEEWKTPEARFAHVMDNLQPMMLNAATDGKSWTEHGIRLEQILNRNRHTSEGSEVLWEYAKENFIQPHLEQGHIKSPE
ncbi:MAG: HD domain-containing protein [Eubacterium sp.]|nr:HD domain-containing protein [Eubacterium sp.]